MPARDAVQDASADAAPPPRAVPPAAGTAAQTAAFVVLCLVWSSTWLVIKEGLEDLPTFGSAAARFLIAGLVMLPLAPRLARREGGTPPATWLWLVVGTMQFAFSFGVVYWSEQHLPSALVSLLWATYPLLIAVAGRIVLPDERLGARQWLGLSVGFAGVALLFLTDLRSLGPECVPAGLVLLLSPLSSSISTVLVKRHGGGTSSALLNRAALLHGGVLLAVASFVAGERWPAETTARGVFSLAYLSVIGTVLTFSLFFWLMRHMPAYRLALISYVTPGLAMLLGAAVGGEPVGPTTLLGAAVILAGVALSAKKKS